jgi:hypothetical protein
MTAGRAPLSRGKGTPRTDSIGRRLTCSQVTGLVSGTKGTASAGRRCCGGRAPPSRGTPDGGQRGSVALQSGQTAPIISR